MAYIHLLSAYIDLIIPLIIVLIKFCKVSNEKESDLVMQYGTKKIKCNTFIRHIYRAIQV